MSSSKREYWRSLDDLRYCWDGSCTAGPESAAQGQQYICRPNEETAPPDDDPQGLSRRRWLQLMGASMALAAAGGCRWEKTELLAFAKRPPGRVPGKIEKFATAMELGGSALGLMVTCVDGRPIKIEGNPKHPYSLGATNAYAQAAILELYDPDRSKHIIERTPEGDRVRTWDEFAAFAKQHFGELRKTGGEGFAVLAEPSSSPTLWALRKKVFDAFPKSRWHEFEPIETGTLQDRAQYALDKADVIVCIDADLFGTHPNAVRHAHEFANRREAADGKMSRLYVVESCYTITGAMADHRLAMGNQQIGSLVAHLIEELKADQPRRPRTGDHPAERFVRALADDMRSHRGKCAIVAGSQQPEHVRWLTESLHAKFGDGEPTLVSVADTGRHPDLQIGTIESLASSIGGGGVRTLVILGGDPVYTAPTDLQIPQLLARVGTSVHLGRYRDETSQHCTWHVPQAHFLESWGDVQTNDDAYSVAQPMMEPLWGGKSAIEVLALSLEEGPRNGNDLMRDQFRKLFGAEKIESRWREMLHEGILHPDLPESHTFRSIDQVIVKTTPSSDWNWDGRTLELLFRPDSKLYDGRFANNGWLQEMPDPMTKLTWDNAALMSPATAEKLGVAHEDVVKLKFKGREVEAPVYVMPGQADGTVAVSLGYGRTAAGKVGGCVADGIEPVGFDAYKLRTTDALWFGTGLTVEPTGKKHRFATTHDRVWLDQTGAQGRAERVGELVHEMTLQKFLARGPHPSPLPKGEGTKNENPLPTGEGTENESLWQEPTYKGRRWGMTIDLSKCVGCGACVIACQAENNVPVVGKQRVLRGREMHWLRIDRYFQGDPAADGTRRVPATDGTRSVPATGKGTRRAPATGGPKVVFQPLPCQQCELAPCEEVCPVGATSHSKEGLNDMAYNRCIGVRYCANNCPFKVRRFNFFNYHKDLEDPANEVAKMVYNPQVTVRSRGVMEKCTYCVQRIQAAKIEAKNHRRTTIPDGEIKTACQQACPTRAIVFGDLNDKESLVAKQHQSPRAYQMLAELNLKPRTSYLARIRNPNPELDDV